MPTILATPHRRAAARRDVSAAAGLLSVLLALLLVSACSSSGSSGAKTTTPPPSSTSAGSGSSSSTPSTDDATTAQITQVWTTFFAGSTPAATKEGLLQDGPEFAAAISAQASSPTATQTTATVAKVSLLSADQATVAYSISIGGQVALPNQSGLAVRVAGAWKVAAASFCQLLSLEGSTPPGCPAASSSPAVS